LVASRRVPRTKPGTVSVRGGRILALLRLGPTARVSTRIDRRDASGTGSQTISPVSSGWLRRRAHAGIVTTKECPPPDDAVHDALTAGGYASQ